MTRTQNLITASDAFWEQFDPFAQLKYNLHDALDNGNLHLVLMASRPPTQEECELGIQVLQAGTDDLPVPIPSLQRREGPTSIGLPVLGVCKLDGDDWISLEEALSAKTGRPVSVPEAAMSLLPKEVTEDHNASVRISPMTARHYLSGRYDTSARKRDSRPRWALLTSNLREARAMHWGRQRAGNGILVRTIKSPSTTSYTNPDVDRVVLDFRGGIPLSVGPRGSAACVWLDTVEWHDWSGTYYLSSAQVQRIHVPFPSKMAA